MLRLVSIAWPRSVAFSLAAGMLCATSLAAQEKKEPPTNQATQPGPTPPPAAPNAPPENRLDELERLRREFAPAAADQPPLGGDQATLAGTVATADGSPLPQGIMLGGSTLRAGYIGAFAVPVNREGRFSHKVEHGRIFVYLTASGFAPTILGPLEAKPGGKIEDVRLVLDRGFVGQIRVVDDQGQPVAGARLQTSYLAGEGGNGPQVGVRQVATNDQGLAVLEHCAARPLIVETETPGFELERAELLLRPEMTVEWKLRTARPVRGVVVARETGEPLAGAQVRLVHREGFAPRTYTPQTQNEHEKPPLLATTDQDGRFALTTLRDDSQYAIYVTAPDRGGEIVPGVRSGTEGLRVELGPPRYVRGKVVGDLGRLERRPIQGEMTPVIRCLNPLRLGSMVYQIPLYVPVAVRDGEGHFEVRDLFPGQLRLELPGQTKTLAVSEGLDDVVIDLAPPLPMPEAVPKRKVVLKLLPPKDEPPPRGELVVHIFPTRPGAAFEAKTLPLANNQVEFEAAVPCRIQWQTDNLVGYWIKEEQIDLAEAPDPLVKELPAIPAGAIYGQVREPDGSPCEAFLYTVWTVSPAPEVQQAYLGINMGSVNRDRNGRFVVGPLPLGGTYRIEIQGQGDRAYTRAASEDLTLTRAASVGRVALQMPEGMLLAGRVLDPQGNPVAGVEVRLGHRTANRSYEGASVRTDGEGAFRFPHINADLPGAYYLNVQPQQAYRGQQVLWQPKEGDLVVRLQRGWSVAGVLLEHSTGKIIPGATVSARPAQYDQRFYLGAHETRTDSRGRFRFETLEPVPYRFYANAVTAASGAPPWEVDPRAQDEIILSGDVQRGADLVPLPPPPDEP